jgi:glycosyltransferase involved in cell wall biosynthesis
LICVSETTAEDVRELWGVDPDRIVVARHGPGQPLTHTREKLADPEHFLYVGDAEPRKNVPTLLAAYRRYRELVAEPLPLVLAGSASSTAPEVVVDRNPAPSRLAELYATAAALIQPSLYEGFGLTALEAMSVGAPVIASDIPGLRETCGEAARYFDPLDTEALATAMEELSGGGEPRVQFRERGVRRAAEFSWEGSARAHVAAYSLALGNR